MKETIDFTGLDSGEIAEIRALGVIGSEEYLQSLGKIKEEILRMSKERLSRTVDDERKEIVRHLKLGQPIVRYPKEGEPYATVDFEIEPSFQLIRSALDGLPKSAFSQELFDVINQRVRKMYPQFLIQKVSYYTAILIPGEKLRTSHGYRHKSTADVFYGADAFFDFIVNGQRLTVTLDLSLGDKAAKGINFKADLNIVFDDCLNSPSTFKYKFKEYASTEADRIMKKLGEKLKPLTN